MSLFQKTVIDNYLSKVKDEDFDTNWNTFKDYYLKEDTQERIKLKKEEEFQHDFLEFIFDNCLDYNIKDSADQNLFKEVKNVTDSKKADGAIRQGEDIVAVIELKSIKTKDFNEIQKQAFGYKNNHPNCRYVVSSNFQKLRFYIDDATKFEEFDLFKLNKEEFKLLWVCLAKDNLFDGVAKKLKSESILEEESITKKLYKDYSEFRKEIFNNLVESNTEIDKLTLFKKTQKLLDRFLFIFFAEDRGLVPTNSISKIIDQWEDSFTGSDSLYTVFKQYFNLLNEGRPKRGDKEAVFAYNGGLFATDDVLNTIKIDDDLLFKHTKNLSHYDFRSEISVDILGHIFEHSLSEIEEIQKEIGGEEVEKSKRKKDGIFYTPAYITKYMVENTLGKLCNEKKKELEINEDNYSDPKRRTKVRIKNLDSYREWLLDLKICDPACGSGAFLNQTLNFLIDEHTYIDNLKNTYLGGSIPFSDIENSILENNIYGVDINEESVEIAKLSLWLRTAQKDRELTSLSNNIKCGNSLIDEPINEDEGYFKWEKEFPNVFDNGGFDIVIGNPPYTYRNTHNKPIKEYFSKNYLSNEGNFDLYKFFIEKLIYLTKNNGTCSYIVPNTFLSAKTYKKLRKLILVNFQIIELFDLGLDVFENVVVESVIFNFRKSEQSSNKNVEIKIQRDRNRLYSDLESNYFIDMNKYSGRDKTFNIYISDKYSEIIDKIRKDSTELSEICYCTVGINTGYIKDELTSNEKIDNRYFKMLNGKDIGRNYVEWGGEYIMYDADFVKSKGDRGRSLPPQYIFDEEKILVQRTRRGMKRKLVCYYDDSNYYNLNRLSNIVLTNKDYSLKFIYGILNSRLMDFYFNLYFNEYEVKPIHLSQLPISSNKDNKLGSKTELNLSLNKELQEISKKFQRTLQRKFEFDKLSNKLQDWYLLSFDDFIKELNKKKIKLSLSEESEWEEFFNNESMKALEILNSINEVDKEIDKMVYDLYGLTKEEIEIVKNF